MKPIALILAKSLRLKQFIKFCIVGSSGLLVDMVVLHVLAKGLEWNVSLSKVCSAELAMLSNFFLNEVWTFRGLGGPDGKKGGVLRRLLKFQAICCVGIAFAVLLLNLFYRQFGFNLYAANLFAILLVTLWNFWMNALFNWGDKPEERRLKDARNAWEDLPY